MFIKLLLYTVSGIFFFPVNAIEYPKTIDLGIFNFFSEYLNDTTSPWKQRIAQATYDLGFCAFNDAPEIGFFLNALKDDYQLTAAVETGTFLGSTTKYFSAFFDEVHTIEISSDLYHRAKELFENSPNVKCHHGSSE